MASQFEKLFREKYKSKQIKFIEMLRQTAFEMKDIEREDRKTVLRKKVRDWNLWIGKLREEQFDFETDYKIKFKGLQFPITTGDDENPYLIVNLNPERVHVFNTKCRAPIMICLELVNFNEAKEMEEMFLSAAEEQQLQNVKNRGSCVEEI